MHGKCQKMVASLTFCIVCKQTACAGQLGGPLDPTHAPPFIRPIRPPAWCPVDDTLLFLSAGSPPTFGDDSGNRKITGRETVQGQWRREARAKGGGACAPLAALSKGGISIFKEDKKSVCVRSFKCFTVLDNHSPEVS